MEANFLSENELTKFLVCCDKMAKEKRLNSWRDPNMSEAERKEIVRHSMEFCRENKSTTS